MRGGAFGFVVSSTLPRLSIPMESESEPGFAWRKPSVRGVQPGSLPVSRCSALKTLNWVVRGAKVDVK